MTKVLHRVQMGDLRLGEEELAAIMDVAGSDRLSPGPFVQEFEDQFSARHGCEYGVMTNSGTDALRIALATLKEVHGWEDGDMIIVPSVTFVATINVVLQLNLVPYLVDVGMGTYNMNPDNLEWRLRTGAEGQKPIRGMIVAHLCGLPADMDKLMAIAKTYDLKVIEDSCETMGVGLKGCPVGSWGDIGCFSFYMAHLIVTGVGGMAVTKNPEYERIMRSYMNHGRDPYYIPGRNQPKLSKELLQKRFRFERLGYSCRPTEFEAAIGLAQLKKLDTIIAKRQHVAQQLLEQLEPFHALSPQYRPWDGAMWRDHAYMMFAMTIKETHKIDKFDLCLHLEEAGIETRELLPITNQPCYEGIISRFGNSFEAYSVAEAINRRGFYIPCHQYMNPEDIDRIAEAFQAFFASRP